MDKRKSIFAGILSDGYIQSIKYRNFIIESLRQSFAVLREQKNEKQS
jgi:hypothetical protein